MLLCKVESSHFAAPFEIIVCRLYFSRNQQSFDWWIALCDSHEDSRVSWNRSFKVIDNLGEWEIWKTVEGFGTLHPAIIPLFSSLKMEAAFSCVEERTVANFCLLRFILTVVHLLFCFQRIRSRNGISHLVFFEVNPGAFVRNSK